jgi:hypothetical protein
VPQIKVNVFLMLSVVVHACNLSTWEAEAEESEFKLTEQDPASKNKKRKKERKLFLNLN